MPIKRKTKEAFTLVELSVVIVIMSIMLSTVLVSRSLITSAKINKIQEEYRMFYGAFSMFSDVYGCIPGDCNVSQIPDLMPSLPGYIAGSGTNPATSLCTTAVTANGSAATYMPLNTNQIESTVKRTCAFYELQAAGYLNGLLIKTTPTAVVALANSVPSQHIPYTKFSRTAAWDIRTVTPTAVTTGANSLTVPYSVSQGSTLPPSSTASMSPWAGNLQLVLRDSSSTAINSTAAVPIGDIVSTANPPATYAVTASFAQKLDLKFDDGLPYSGNIASGRTVSQGGTSGVCTDITTTEATAANVVNTAKYLTADALSTGCLVAFLINSNY